WRPGTFPKLVSDLSLDDWSYLVGFTAHEEQIPSIIKHLISLPPHSCEYFSCIEQFTRVLLIHVNCQWVEIYSPDTELLTYFTQWWPGSMIDSKHWTNDASRKSGY